tara:strand:+ start:59 stop:289 length:231 start_codon:yes stop_codon:yes gene_type:complete
MFPGKKERAETGLYLVQDKERKYVGSFFNSEDFFGRENPGFYCEFVEMNECERERKLSSSRRLMVKLDGLRSELWG